MVNRVKVHGIFVFILECNIHLNELLPKMNIHNA